MLEESCEVKDKRVGLKEGMKDKMKRRKGEGLAS